MTEERDQELAAGGELWIGPIGPIPILADDDPRILERKRREAAAAAVLSRLTTVEV